jgi:PST family polysaccharide transporter
MEAAEPEDVRTNADLTETTASGLRSIAFAKIGMEIALLGGMVVLARLIPPAAFGMFAVVLIVQELALSMPMEGIGSAIVQRRSIRREHLEGGMMLSLLVGAALAGATVAVAELIAAPVYGEETASLLLLATPWFLLGAVFSVPAAVLRRRLAFRRLALLDLVMTVTRVVASVALAIVGFDAKALVFGNLAAMAIGVALALAFAPVPLPRWRRDAMRDLLPYGGPAALACVSWTGFRNGDYAIVGATLGPAQAGFYWRGYQLAVEYQKKISATMGQMAFPVLARTAGADEMFELRRRMVRLVTVLLFPMLATLVLLAPVVIPWLFGPAWEPAVLPTQILAVAGASTLLIDAVGSALQAAGRARAMLGYGIAHFVVYAGSVIVVAPYGLAAVSAAAAVTHTLFLVIAYQVLLHGHRESALRLLREDVTPAGVGCLALLAVAGPTAWALADAGTPVLVHIAAVSAAAAIAYLATLRAGFPDAWHDLGAALGRVLPGRGALNRLRSRLPLPVRRVSDSA